MIRVLAAAVALSSLAMTTGTQAQQSFRLPNGVYLALANGTSTELIAYAEQNSRGQLRMQHGSLEDAPVVHEVAGLVSSVPLWRPSTVVVSTAKIFQDEDAETRHLRIASRLLNVYAMAIRVADLERRNKIDSLLKAVKASSDNPGYAFVVLAPSAVNDRANDHFYPIRLTPEESAAASPR